MLLACPALIFEGLFKLNDEFDTPFRLAATVIDPAIILRDRESAIRTYLEALWKRHLLLRDVCTFLSTCIFVSFVHRFVLQDFDKTRNPILATQGAPGMGKSSFLDALAFLKYSVVRQLCPPDATEEFCRGVHGSVRVSVDYNGYQSPSKIDVDYPVFGLAIRILHSYVLCCALIETLERSFLFD